jgi:hypothetical protein
MMSRTTKNVLYDHLELARQGDWQTDLSRNYSENCVLLTNYGVFEGFEGIKQKIRLLQEHLPNASYEYKQILIHAEMGFLVWTADSDINTVSDGADSYLIRNGKVEVMTIHYNPQPKSQ